MRKGHRIPAHLLSRTRVVTRLRHVEMDVLKRCSLRNLPVNGADHGVLRRRADIDDEVPDAAKKVVLIQVPFMVPALA